MKDILDAIKELKWKWFVIIFLLLPFAFLLEGTQKAFEFIHFKITGKIVRWFRDTSERLCVWLDEFCDTNR